MTLIFSLERYFCLANDPYGDRFVNSTKGMGKAELMPPFGARPARPDQKKLFNLRSANHMPVNHHAFPSAKALGGVEPRQAIGMTAEN